MSASQIRTAKSSAQEPEASPSCYLNGVPTPVGYLGDLRLAPEHRSGTLVARGYKFFRILDEDNAAEIYFTAIFSDNAIAQKSLTSSRATIPTYHPLGQFLCPGLLPKHFPRQADVTRGTQDDLPEIITFLNTHNATRQFAPVHHPHDFEKGGRWGGIKATDFFLLRKQGTIAATAALWDQRPFKQTRVLGYRGRWRALRAASIAFAWLGAPRLPKPGSTLPFGYASFLSAHSPDDLAAVLRAALTEARRRRWLYCLAGLHARDPLARALFPFQKVDFTGELFAVSPRHENAYPLDQRIPHVEAATL